MSFLPARGARALRSITAALGTWAILLSSPALGQDPVVPVRVVYDTIDSLDEDDMCYWVHPTDPVLSTVIVTDKFAGKIFVYDLEGNLLQTSPSPSPRNVDTRYNVPFDRGCIDVVAFTDRTEDIIRVYKIDPKTRLLTRIDDGLIFTQDNYGFTLYQHTDGQLWGLTGDRDTGLMRQFALFENGVGKMSGYETSWTFQETRIEGVVADDETGYYYLGEENVGIWRVDVFDHTDKTLIATVGDETGLVGDIEGLALYFAADGGGYIVASSQGDNKFTVIDRKPPHEGRGNFKVDGVRFTDGLDVLNVSLNATYPHGIFTAHNGGSNCCSVAGVSWEDIATALGLVEDTEYWDPRVPCKHHWNDVVFEEVESGGSLVSASVATNAPLAAAANQLYVAAVSIRGGSASVQSVSGLGLSWTFLEAQCSGRGLSKLEIWTAQGTPSGPGPVSATLSSAPLATTIAVSRYSNVCKNPIRNIVSGNTKGLDGACSGGTDGIAYAFDVPTSVAGSFVYGAAAMRHRTHVTAERYRERVERHAGIGGDSSGLAVVDRLVTAPGTIPLVGSFSGTADWIALGFEILPTKHGHDYSRRKGGVVERTLELPEGFPLGLEVTGAPPHSTGILLVSLSRANLSAGAARLAPPFLLRLPLTFDERGNATVSLAAPPALPVIDVALQAHAFAAKPAASSPLRVSITEPRPLRRGI